MGLFGKAVSQQEYDSLYLSFQSLAKKYDALEQKCADYEQKIQQQNELIYSLKEREAELLDDIDSVTRESVDLPAEPASIQEMSVFSVLSALVEQVNRESCTLQDVKSMKANLVDYAKKITDRYERVEDISIITLGQRAHDDGNPMQMGFEIKMQSLNKYEIDIFLSMVRGMYSSSVNASLMEGGYIALEVDGGYTAVVQLTFGSWGDASAPTFSFYTDVYNENWKDKYLSEVYVKVPYEIENLVAKFGYEYRMNIWRKLAEKGLPPLG